MHKTFGEPTYSMTAPDINDLAKRVEFIQGKSGIYTIVNKSNASYTGHIDMMINGKCISGSAYLSPGGGVEKLEIWQFTR